MSYLGTYARRAREEQTNERGRQVEEAERVTGKGENRRLRQDKTQKVR